MVRRDAHCVWYKLRLNMLSGSSNCLSGNNLKDLSAINILGERNKLFILLSPEMLANVVAY